MYRLLRWLLVFSAFFPSTSSAAAADLTLGPASNYLVPVVVKGVTLNLRVDPGADGAIVINRGAAARAKLKASIFPLTAAVGPVTVRGRWMRSTMVIAGSQSRGRFIWFDRDVVAGADGLISPALLPFDNVHFQIRAPGAREAAYVVPVQFAEDYGLRRNIMLGDRPVAVKFKLNEARTSATAAVGALLASRHQGAWDGDAFREVVQFGVERPLRPLKLAVPLNLNGLQLRRLAVRTSDFRGNYQLPADSSEDEGAIVVTGKRRGQPPRFSLTVGQDRLAACSSISYRRAEQQLVMMCPPADAD
jgi:hypothetical protein